VTRKAAQAAWVRSWRDVPDFTTQRESIVEVPSVRSSLRKSKGATAVGT